MQERIAKLVQQIANLVLVQSSGVPSQESLKVELRLAIVVFAMKELSEEIDPGEYFLLAPEPRPSPGFRHRLMSRRSR